MKKSLKPRFTPVVKLPKRAILVFQQEYHDWYWTPNGMVTAVFANGIFTKDISIKYGGDLYPEVYDAARKMGLQLKDDVRKRGKK